MAEEEEEVKYASVVFKTNKHSPREAKKEEETEVVYSEVKVQSKTTENTADANVSTGLLPDKKTNRRGRCYQQVACCLGILCVILLLGITAVCVYVVTLIHESEPNQLKENQTILLALNHNLTNLNNKLSSENENLRRDNDNLTVQFNNLTQDYTVSESKITNLSAENKNLTSHNTKLSAENKNLTSHNTKLSAENKNLTSQNTKLSEENQNMKSQKMKLETERNNLTEQMRIMETKWNELNVSQAQWSLDAYCPKPQNQNRTCKACQAGWTDFQSSCYAVNNPERYPDQKTWEEARENCKGKISDLAVVADKMEKTFINDHSWGSSGTSGYWIGLKAEDEKWKWVDGSDLTDNSWIQQPATNGQCVISVLNEGWKSVSCAAKNRWICKKKALSV